jgi:hypothetical protein
MNELTELHNPYLTKSHLYASAVIIPVDGPNQERIECPGHDFARQVLTRSSYRLAAERKVDSRS